MQLGSHLFVDRFPWTPTRVSFKHCLDNPVLWPLHLSHLILTLPWFLSSELRSCSSPLRVYQPPSHSSSLPFYSPPLVGTQMITFLSFPMWPSLLPRIPSELVHSEDSLETSTWRRIAFGSRFPQGTNNVRGQSKYWLLILQSSQPARWHWAKPSLITSGHLRASILCLYIMVIGLGLS